MIRREGDATRFDPATQLAFNPNGDGTLTVIHEDSPNKFSLVQNAKTEQYARSMAVNPANHDLYLVTAEIETSSPAKGNRPHCAVKPGTFAWPVGTRK